MAKTIKSKCRRCGLEQSFEVRAYEPRVEIPRCQACGGSVEMSLEDERFIHTRRPTGSTLIQAERNQGILGTRDGRRRQQDD